MKNLRRPLLRTKFFSQTKLLLLLLTLFGSHLANAQWWVAGIAAKNSQPAVQETRIIVDKSGTEDYTTVQSAIDAATPGDTILINPGTYREDLLFSSSGAVDSAIVLMAADELNKPIITALEPKSGFSLYSGQRYYANNALSPIPFKNQVVKVNGTYLLPGNTTFKDAGVYSTSDLLWDRVLSITTYNTNYTVTDTNLIGEYPDDEFVGMWIGVQTNSWSFRYFEITDFASSTGVITFDNPTASNFSVITQRQYLIIGNEDYLLASGQYYQDATNLYVTSPGFGDVSLDTVEVRQRIYVADLAGNDRITFKNIVFEGGKFASEGCDFLKFDGCSFYYPDWDFGVGAEALKENFTALIIDGTNFTMENSYVEGICNRFLDLSGDSATIHNNSFYKGGFMNRDGIIADITDSKNVQISYNTMNYFGHSVIAGRSCYRAELSHNDVSYFCLLTQDVGAFGFGNGDYFGINVHHNVFTDFPPMSAGVYWDAYSVNCVSHHNVFSSGRSFNNIYGVWGWARKINFHMHNVLEYHNTTVLFGWWEGSSASTYESYYSRFCNNIYNLMDADFATYGVFFAGNAHYPDINDTLIYVNTAERDWRLNSTATLAIDQGILIPGINDDYLGAAPDAGAIEYGEPMWEYGHDFENPPTLERTWKRAYGQSAIDDGSFEKHDGTGTMTVYWDSIKGTPDIAIVDVWNYKDFEIAKQGKRALKLMDGDSIGQLVTGLTPSTDYFVSSNTKIIGGHYNVAVSPFVHSRAFSASHYLNQYSIYDLVAGDWLYYPDMDFHSGEFDIIEVAITPSDTFGIELLIDDVSGTVIGSGTVTGDVTLGWQTKPISVSSISGVHDLYVKITNVGSSEDRIDAIRLIDTTTPERITVKDATSGRTKDVGGAYFAEPDTMHFTTGPGQTSTYISFSKGDGGFMETYTDLIFLIAE